MDLEPYLKITRNILQYHEMRLGLGLFRALILVTVAVLVLLAVFHMLYYLGRRTPLYRKKAPVDGWNRRFFMALTFLLMVLFLVAWGIELLLK